jgi:hypothetical protein
MKKKTKGKTAPKKVKAPTKKSAKRPKAKPLPKVPSVAAQAKKLL